MAIRSPFPGMDPYLEHHWLDVHSRLVIYAGDQLQQWLPRDLRARVEERVFIEPPESLAESLYPDVRVIEHSRSAEGTRRISSGIAVAEPLVLNLEAEIEPMRQGYLEIIDVSTGNRVVTVIEFVSPTNKMAGDALRQYLKKQEEVVSASSSLVEIDLTRKGERKRLWPEHLVHPPYRTAYQIWVRRGWHRGRAEYYQAPLRKHLPTIPIPLRETDEDVPLDIQALIDQSYANGRYDDLNYREPPRPPLGEEDAAWADELLKSAGKR